MHPLTRSLSFYTGLVGSLTSSRSICANYANQKSLLLCKLISNLKQVRRAVVFGRVHNTCTARAYICVTFLHWMEIGWGIVRWSPLFYVLVSFVVQVIASSSKVVFWLLCLGLCCFVNIFISTFHVLALEKWIQRRIQALSNNEQFMHGNNAQCYPFIFHRPLNFISSNKSTMLRISTSFIQTAWWKPEYFDGVQRINFSQQFYFIFRFCFHFIDNNFWFLSFLLDYKWSYISCE